ncbi:MAG: nucleotidyltransferase domain-containing protein [Candidatus Cloacimonetes bacterium]|nr:nucleotidyltransferase domain-containing protein [Candidatus Cloacimonadota bacterium]
MKDFREKIKEELKQLFQSHDSILAVWEGGSAATGFLDEYSDLDIGMIAEDKAIETVFEQIEELLEKNYGIQHVFKVPDKMWHEHAHRFYIIDNSTPLFYVDILIEKESATGNRFLESDRHGIAQTWFDRKNLIDQTPTPDDVIQKKGKFFFQYMRDYLPIQIMEIKKNLARNNKIDALRTYQQLFGQMAYLLNLKYRKNKYDFGLRYAERAYPKKIVSFLEEMMFVKDIDEIKEKLPEVEKMFEELVKELKETLI